MHDHAGAITRTGLLLVLCVVVTLTTACGDKPEKPRVKTFLFVEQPGKVSDLSSPALGRNSEGELFLSLFIHSAFPSATDAVEAIVILKSDDHGATWQEISRIRSRMTYGVWGCDLAIDSQDNLCMTWVSTGRETDNPQPFKAIMFSRSDDGGRTWTEPRCVSKATTGQRHSPVIAVSGDHIHLAWLDQPLITSSARGISIMEDVYYASSSDRGATWSENLCVETDRQYKNSSSGAPALWVTANGTVHCAYFSMRKQPKQVRAGAWIATSTDQGKSFTTNLVPAGALGDICLTEADGNLCLAIVHLTGIKRISMHDPQTYQEILFYTSSDNGAKWSKQVRIDDDLDKRHKSNLRLVSLGRKSLAACWHDERGGVYMAVSPDSGKTWGKNVKIAGKSRVGVTPIDVAVDTSSGVFYIATSDVRKGSGDATHITTGKTVPE